MSRTVRHRIAALAVVALALAGCGTQSGTGKEPGRGSGSAGASSSAAPTGTSAGACAARPALDAGDSGRRVCLPAGGVIRVALDGTAARPWTSVTADGPGLRAVNSGIVLLPGDASAAFEAVSAGTVRISASRPLCASATGRVACKGLQEWWVTVVVTKR
ncbi:hypothetical protein ABZT03_03350 [Streptomyces sp. NPDC005574]|uniref:hypothetical protein n=1 Tax=Streptomyces sp. NPDC005574 TaxID=3156891 RepID=UPI0033B11657